MSETPIYAKLLRDHYGAQARRIVQRGLLPLLSCGHCGAVPGQPCVTPSGRILPAFHVARGPQ